MDRQERLTHIIRLLQDLSLTSMEIKARFSGVSPRTIERDLEQLAQEGRIHQVRRDRSRNPSWETGERAPTIEVRWMNGRTAAAVKMMEGCLSCLLPPALLKDLHPLFLRADHALQQAHNREYAEWLRKIRIWPIVKEENDGRPAIDHLREIQEALLRNRAIALALKGGDMPHSPRRLHPQGLLFSREGIHLFVAENHDTEPLKISLHDIHDVRMLDEPAKTHETFEMDAITKGSFLTGAETAR